MWLRDARPKWPSPYVAFPVPRRVLVTRIASAIPVGCLWRDQGFPVSFSYFVSTVDYFRHRPATPE